MARLGANATQGLPRQRSISSAWRGSVAFGGWAYRRLRLTAEIIGANRRARRELARAPIRAAVARLRPDGLRAPEPATASLAEAHRLAAAVVRLLAVLPGDTRCLRRSLVLLQLLGRRGIQGKLVIAVRPEPEFLAHAWVESHGQPLLSPAGGSFARLVEL